MQTQEKFWDRIAPRYARMPIRNADDYQATLEKTRGYLRPEDTGLEIGCGTGGTARLLAPHVQQMTATDIAPKMIEIAEQRAADQGSENITHLACDLEGAPDGPFDVVLAHNLVHLLPDPVQGLRQIHARLKPGGLFISKTVCLGETGLNWKLKLVLKVLPLLRILGKAPPVHLMSIATLEGAIRQAGFEMIEAGNYPDHPPARYIVARRI